MSSDDAPERVILARLGLARVGGHGGITDQLLVMIRRFRVPQQGELAAALQQLPDPVCQAMAAYFDRRLAVKDECERYLQDLLKLLHYLHHHDRIDAEVARAMVTLLAALGDSGDRTLLTRHFQLLGAASPAMRVFCRLALMLPLKLQQEFYVLFAEDPSQLRVWMQLLVSIDRTTSQQGKRPHESDSKRGHGGATGGDGGAAATATATADKEDCGSPLEVVLHFIVTCCMEKCAAAWLALLRPLPSPLCVAVMRRLMTEVVQVSATWKPLVRFYTVTSLPVATLLELCPALLTACPIFLMECPMATTLSVVAKFNSDRAIATLLSARDAFGGEELIKLVDALAAQDLPPSALELFVTALVAYAKKFDVLFLFLSRSPLHQWRILDLLHRATPALRASTAMDTHHHLDDHAERFALFHLLLSAKQMALDAVIVKLNGLSADAASATTAAMATYEATDVELMGEGVEAIEAPCLATYLHLYHALAAPLRALLVDWVQDVPAANAQPVYDVLVRLASNDSINVGDDARQRSDAKLEMMLRMLTSLRTKDKHVLCNQILAPSNSSSIAGTAATPTPTTPAGTSETTPTPPTINETVLSYLCECTLSRHKAVTLLAVIDRNEYEGLLFLLRTQRMPEQVALTTLMLSLSRPQNMRLLAKVKALETDILDEFFQLLLLLPKCEYKMLARLLVSANVTSTEFQNFVHMAANMMNQASSREMVAFTADLPAPYRTMLLAMLSPDMNPEKGVLLRIVACAPRFAPALLHSLVELLARMPWATRSALVEQIRALEQIVHAQNYVLLLRDFDDDQDLSRLVYLLNMVPPTVRIALVTRMTPLSLVERVRALSKLDVMPKDSMPLYCQSLVNAETIVGAAYLRMFGVLDRGYQSGMLVMLKYRTCWRFLDILSDAVQADGTGNAANNTSSMASSDCAMIVNGMAAVLTLLVDEDDYVLLRRVLDDALMHAIQLEEFIVVVSHFNTRSTLLAFLAYVSRLTAWSQMTQSPPCTTLFFRTLAKYQTTVFLFEMCCILDQDDAIFALYQLDRMWFQEAAPVDAQLKQMAAVDAIRSKDAFCNLILGFKERGATSHHTGSLTSFLTSTSSFNPSNDRVIFAQSSLLTNVDIAIDADAEKPPQSTEAPALNTFGMLPGPSSLRPIQLGRLVHPQTQCDAKQKPRRHINWREWRQSDWEDVLEHPTMDGTNQVSGDEQDNHSVASCANGTGSIVSDPVAETVLPSMEASGRSEGDSDVSHLPTDTSPPITKLISKDSKEPRRTSGTIKVNPGKIMSCDVIVLPPISSQHTEQGKHLWISSDTSRRSHAPSRNLARSESAPTTLVQSTTFQSLDSPKLYRGLNAALDLPSALTPIVRDRGSSIFRKQCEYVEEHGPCRIRVGKSLAAQSKVLAARIDLALGQRTATSTSPKQSVLIRSDRQTIKHATLAIHHAKQTRDTKPVGFV